jgi:hypothetical protein
MGNKDNHTIFYILLIIIFTIFFLMIVPIEKTMIFFQEFIIIIITSPFTRVFCNPDVHILAKIGFSILLFISLVGYADEVADRIKKYHEMEKKEDKKKENYFVQSLVVIIVIFLVIMACGYFQYTNISYNEYLHNKEPTRSPYFYYNSPNINNTSLDTPAKYSKTKSISNNTIDFFSYISSFTINKKSISDVNLNNEESLYNGNLHKTVDETHIKSKERVTPIPNRESWGNTMARNKTINNIKRDLETEITFIYLNQKEASKKEFESKSINLSQYENKLKTLDHERLHLLMNIDSTVMEIYKNQYHQ